MVFLWEFMTELLALIRRIIEFLSATKILSDVVWSPGVVGTSSSLATPLRFLAQVV